MKKTAKQYAIALYELSQNASDVDVQNYVGQIAQSLKDAGDGYMLERVLKEYRTILVKKSELPEVHVRSAAELDDVTIKDLLASLAIDPQTTVISQTDPEMIGGVFVKNNNKLFDRSLARRLARLGQRLKSVK